MVIPAHIGREVCHRERQLLVLPLRHGGLGLTNPQTNAKTEYNNFMLITAKLTDQIYNKKLGFTTPQTSNIIVAQKANYDKRRTQNARISVTNYLRN